MIFRIIKYTFISLFLIITILILGIDYFINISTKKQIFNNIKIIPKNKVGLLLGTSKYKDKAKHIINPYYQNRIDAAVELYMTGKIDYIIVSGDNSTQYYNEPELMRTDLLARGVPFNKIILDNAGFRTLDSILRCKDIFGQQKFTIISQEFHNKRAVFIAKFKNLDVVAYNATDGDAPVAESVREKFARIKMIFDLILNNKAKLYGESIEIK